MIHYDQVLRNFQSLLRSRPFYIDVVPWYGYHGNDSYRPISTSAGKMVKLHVKRGEDSLFLFETTCEVALEELIPSLVKIQNGRLKVDRLCQGTAVFR